MHGATDVTAHKTSNTQRTVNNSLTITRREGTTTSIRLTASAVVLGPPVHGRVVAVDWGNLEQRAAF